MQGWIRDRWGTADVLRLAELPVPELAADQVLVRQHATSVNAHDWHSTQGKPYIARIGAGLRRPRPEVIGLDVAGTVEAVGAAVTDVGVGDRVFGSRYGAFAEVVAGRNVVAIPAGITFEQAAAVPCAGQTALQGLRDHGHLEAGQHVLVHGAGGGVGSMAVQIAKALGAEVTAVTRSSSADMVRSIGADHVIEHPELGRTRDRYDLVLDVGGTRSVRFLRRRLRPRGSLVLVAPAPGNWIGPVARMGVAALSSRFSRSRPVRFFISTVSRDDLEFLAGLLAAGSLRPVIDRTVPFERLPDAVRHVETGRARGKVVVTFPAASGPAPSDGR